MEDPQSWGLAEKTIDQALKDQEEATEMGVCGYSTAMTISVALRKAGFILVPMVEEEVIFMDDPESEGYDHYFMTFRATIPEDV